MKAKKMKMHLDTKTGVLIIAAVAILVVILIAAFVFKSGAPQGTAQPGANATATTVYAPQGEIVAGFPKELILDDQARVANSYSVNYNSSVNQYTVEWNSSSSMSSLYTKYKDYFTANHWKITNDYTKQSFLRVIAGMNGSNSLGVSITSLGSGSHVVIGYVVK